MSVCEVIFDERTGFPLGDHGAAEDAIDFALDSDLVGYGETDLFLAAWRDGSAADEWPEFYEWLRDRQAARKAAEQSKEGGE